MLGSAESTDPRPRRKTNEPQKPDKDKQEKRWIFEAIEESRKEKELWEY